MKKRKGKSTAAAKSKAKKKAKEDGEYEGSSENEYTAVSKSLWTMGGNGNSKPPVGSFEKCARCEKQFTVVIMVEFTLRLEVTSLFFVPFHSFCTQTRYTLTANPPPGYLCHQCAKASGADPFKKPAAPQKRKPATEKREVINFEERRFPTLASLCIEVIVQA